MPLVKNKIPLPFSSGLQTKTDRQQDQLSGLRVLENTIFDTPQKLLKRKGYSLVDTKLFNNVEIADARFLSVFEEELGLYTKTNYYSYSQSINKWTNKGRVFTAFPESKSILRNNKQQKNIDTITVENINVFTYEDSSGVRVSLVDNANCNFLLSDSLISSTGTHPRVVNIENTIYIVYIDSTDIKFRKINILNPETIEAEQTFTSDVETTHNNFDAARINNKVFISYNSSVSSGTIRAGSIDADDNISSLISIVGESASSSLSLSTDSASRVIISYSNGSEIKTVVFSFTLGKELLAPTIIESIASVTNVTLIETALGTYNLLYEVSAASDKNHYVKNNTLTLLGAVGTPSIVKRSVGLASKSFIFNSEVHATLVHASTLQSTYFVTTNSGTVVSKFSSNVGGTIITENVLTKVSTLEDDKFLLGSQIKGRTISDSDTFFSLLGVNSTTLDFSLNDPFQNETLGKNQHIAGGVLMMYDGDHIVEHGFHIFPEDLTAGSTATTGGFLSDGDFQYAAVYTWTDSKGQLHRSAPSIGFPVTLSGGTNTQTQEVVIPSLRITQKEDVAIELYRTENAGTIFYKVTNTISPVLNDSTVDTITITDSITDADLINNEVLYTTGGVLDNIVAPSSSIIESFSDRIFLAGLEDENNLSFSKIRFEGSPVEFNDSQIIPVNSKGGPISALKAMDEKLIIFKESAIFYLSGDGPNNLGEQDTFIKPELISSDIGCINVNSVVLTPLGLMFKSRKGIYLLSQSLQLQYIGASVEAFNDLKITSATVISEENQVRFTTLTGDTLVYNYFVQQWASFTNHRALSAINVKFTYYYLRNDGTLYVEDNDSYTDNGSPININLESGWVSFAGLQGFQRVYKLLLLGNFHSPHKIRIRIAYDFNEAFTQEVIIDTADFNDNTRYGGYSPYGDPATAAYGGDGNVHQMRVDLKRQKCQAIKIKIEEIQSDPENYGQGLSLSNISFEVGTKIGTNKLDQGKTYGTK